MILPNTADEMGGGSSPLKAAISVLALAAALPLWAQQPIHLKTRTIHPDLRESSLAGLPGAHRSHYMVQFSGYPGAEIRRELARRRVRVLRYLPDSVLMVSSAPDADLAGLGVISKTPLDAQDKLSPQLEKGSAAAYLVVFHPDVDADVARGLAEQRGFTVHETAGALPGHLVVAGGLSGLRDLAQADEVSYILPARADLAFGKSVRGCPGALTEAGVLAEYATAGSGWAPDAGGGVSLKYSVQSLAASLDPSAARLELQRAFRQWSTYANTNFTETSSAITARTISILFASRAHADSYAFDGRGGVIAHTFYPPPANSEPIAGDMHFDADELWRIGADVDLYSVALHEAGHALGLVHSDDPSSVMYPYYQMTAGLSEEDIAAIRRLYGPASAEKPPSGPGTPTPPSPIDSTSPTLRITAPGQTITSTSSAVISISGTAGDNAGLAAVRWSTSTGYSGTAAGTRTWTASIPLLVGTNAIKVVAYDAAGNTSWRSLTVVRR